MLVLLICLVFESVSGRVEFGSVCVHAILLYAVNLHTILLAYIVFLEMRKAKSSRRSVLSNIQNLEFTNTNYCKNVEV